MNAKEMDELLDQAVNLRDHIVRDLDAMEEMVEGMNDRMDVDYAKNTAEIWNLKAYEGYECGLKALRERALQKLDELDKKIDPVWQEINPHKK